MVGAKMQTEEKEQHENLYALRPLLRLVINVGGIRTVLAFHFQNNIIRQ